MADALAMLEEWTVAWAAHDMSRLLALFTDDCVYEDVALGVVNHGKDELKKYGEEFFVAMPDVNFVLDSKVAGGAFAGVEWTMTGTQTGDYPEMPATGRSCTVRGASVLELRDGLFSRCSDYYDMLTLLKQLGHMS
jgi:steroid delta-isomerase-like uncharacterized protein